MTIVKLEENEPFEAALRRFKRKCVQAGIFTEVRKRRFYEKPSIRKRKKAASARRQAMKRGDV
ncbi:MAG: 30S ribosomal protein S21 [Thermodesulfobacteriota bacterium]|nr:30S ribosomal protein S21 [Thermodesulfobacteriota bacterium]